MSEFKGKNRKDLVKALAEKRDALQTFRFGVTGGKTKNVKEGKLIRKQIAQIQTELHAQALASSNESVTNELKTA